MRTCSFVFALAAPLLAQQSDAILAKISAEASNVLVVRDVMKPLEQLLAAPATKELLLATADAQKELFGVAFSPEMLGAQIGLFAPFVPTEIVVAAPTRTADRLTHAIAFGVDALGLVALARAADADAELVQRLRQDVLEHLQQFDDMPVQAWVRTRDKRTAEQWFDAATGWAGKQGKTLGVECKSENDRLKLRWAPFAEGSPLRKVLERAQVPMTAAPAAAWEATLQIDGDRLSLQIGSFEDPPCPADRFGPAWAGEPLLFAHVDLDDRAADVADSYLRLLEVGAEELTASDQAIVDRVQAQLLRLATEFGNDTIAVGVGPEGAWAQREHTYDSPPGDELDFVPNDLLRLADVQSPFWVVSDSLDAALAATWSDIVSRAEGRGLEAWSEQFADVAEYLSDEESAVFAPGVLAVARGARFRGAKGWTRGPMPFVAGALVAIPKSVAEGEAFVRELTGRVATGFGVEAPKWESADLGLGVPTHALRLDGLAAREFDGDFRPHWFFIGSRMVVSSDPQLSKELQRRAADEPTAKPPADLLCEWWRIEGPVLVDACTGLERWARAWPDHGEIPGIQMLGPACRMLAAACEHVERIERSSVVQERSLRDRWQLRLRAAK